MRSEGLEAMVFSLAVTGVFLLTFPPPAHAYLDPGSASLMWQILIAGGLTLAYFVKRYWRKIARVFRRDSLADNREDEDSAGE